MSNRQFSIAIMIIFTISISVVSFLMAYAMSNIVKIGQILDQIPGWVQIGIVGLSGIAFIYHGANYIEQNEIHENKQTK